MGILGVFFSVFSGHFGGKFWESRISGWGVFFRYFSRKYRVGPSRVSIAGRGVPNGRVTPDLGVLSLTSGELRRGTMGNQPAALPVTVEFVELSGAGAPAAGGAAAPGFSAESMGHHKDLSQARLTLIFFSLPSWRTARKTTKKTRIFYACRRTPKILGKEGKKRSKSQGIS